MSPICFILLLLILIMIPTLIYTIFFFLPCVSRREELQRGSRTTDDFSTKKEKIISNMELVTIIAKFDEEGNKGDECPVCLSGFNEGEELRKLNYCKHLFHSKCIDKWLFIHSNCPLCRALVGFKPRVFVKEREENVWQGLPDSSTLV